MAEEQGSAAEAGSYTRGALRKAWKGYRIAKVQNDEARMKEYAEKIRALQKQLDVPLATFLALASAR